MSGFDRIKPPAERLKERDASRAPDSAEADVNGRAALFSAADAARPAPEKAPRRSAASEALAERGRRLLLDDDDATAPPLHSGGRRRRPDVTLDDRSAPAAPDPVAGETVDDAPGQAPESEDVADEELPRSRSLLTVECGHCGDVCPMPLSGALKRALPLAVIAPWRSHPVFAVCPCGQRRAWLKPSVGMPRP